jgi:hypothetical protein
MPLTTNTTWAPGVSPDGADSAFILEFPAGSVSIPKGALVIQSSGKGAHLNAASLSTEATIDVLGFAHQNGATATAGYTDTVLVACAMPGQLFEGNLVSTGGTSDVTGTYTADVLVDCSFVGPSAATNSYYCLIANTTATAVWAKTLKYAGVQKLAGATSTFTTGYGNGVGIVNPRMVFTFVKSFFMPSNLSVT